MDFPATIRETRAALAEGATSPAKLAKIALARANANAGRNTYLWRDRAWTMNEAARAATMAAGSGGQFGDGRANLWGIPVSVKDCFDLAGTPTSCGVKFYREVNGIAAKDSWLVEQLRKAGAVITGKTHLHPLAYGITGENPEFGDCEQPGNPGALTGGSSSGAAASVLEGSALAAIGTDTGGSIRGPAALCGLAGYRASIGRGDWRGGAHLAQSFDTMGWLFRDLEDGPLLAETFAPSKKPTVHGYRTFAVVDDRFLNDCEPAIVEGMRSVTDNCMLSASAARRSNLTGVTMPLKSLRRSRPGRRHAFMPGISKRFSRHYENGWCGEPASRIQNWQFCVNGMRSFVRASMTCFVIIT